MAKIVCLPLVKPAAMLSLSDDSRRDKLGNKVFAIFREHRLMNDYICIHI